MRRQQCHRRTPPRVFSARIVNTDVKSGDRTRPRFRSRPHVRPRSTNTAWNTLPRNLSEIPVPLCRFSRPGAMSTLGQIWPFRHLRRPAPCSHVRTRIRHCGHSLRKSRNFGRCATRVPEPLCSNPQKVFSWRQRVREFPNRSRPFGGPERRRGAALAWTSLRVARRLNNSRSHLKRLTSTPRHPAPIRSRLGQRP
jgi:hypothetical protein